MINYPEEMEENFSGLSAQEGGHKSQCVGRMGEGQKKGSRKSHVGVFQAWRGRKKTHAKRISPMKLFFPRDVQGMKIEKGHITWPPAQSRGAANRCGCN